MLLPPGRVGKREAEGPPAQDESVGNWEAAEGSPPSESGVSDCWWDGIVESELLRYEKKKRGDGDYEPKGFNKDQLAKAALEFQRRYDREGEEDSCCYGVLVSRGVDDLPRRELEREALQGTELTKLWYALTKAKDLLIIKASSKDPHSRCEKRLTVDLAAFADQYPGIFDVDGDGNHILLSGTTVAPDGFLQRIHPEQSPDTTPMLRTPLVVELEVGNRGPKALMEQLGEYLQQPVSEYVLGIKIYYRSGDPVQPPARRPFSAIAALWRRARSTRRPRQRARPVRVRGDFVGIWSFGTAALDARSVAAFTKQQGQLSAIPRNRIVHPATNLDIAIPAANLLQGAVYHQGTVVPVLANGNDLVIRLGLIREICERRLPHVHTP